MTHLRVDPWDPEYGASAVDLLAEEGPQAVEFAIEDRPWQPVAPSPIDDLPCCAFVDGVRRIDVRLFAEEESHVAPALAGSWAVGCAWTTRPPAIDDVVVGRNLVVGGGLVHPNLEVRVGVDEFLYESIGVSGADPLDPIVGLQNVMRRLRRGLRPTSSSSGEADLVVQTGR